MNADQPQEPKVLTDAEKTGISDKMKNIFAFLDEDAEKEAEARRQKAQYDAAALDERNVHIYASCLRVAETLPQAELLTTYIQDWFDPAAGKLDAWNLHLNLLFVRNLLRFGSVMQFSFTDEPRKALADDPNLDSESWKTIMEDETTSTPEKRFIIADKWIRALFYKHLFSKLHPKADTGTYNRELFKSDLIISDDENLTFEKGLAKYIENRSNEGAVVIASRNTIKFFNYTEEREDYEPQGIYHKGDWRGRVLQQYDPAELLYMKEAKYNVYVIHRGEVQQNLITVDSRKPLVYMQLVENPMLARASMVTYLNVDFDFLNSATANIYLDDAVH